MEKVPFSDVVGIGGIALATVLMVLDKAGKLKGSWLFGLLCLAGAMTLFIAVDNSWVMDAPEKWRLWRGALMVASVVFAYSGMSIWISPSDKVAEGQEEPKPESRQAKPDVGTTIPSPSESPVALFMECEWIYFPINIARGTTAHVLRIHPSTIKRNVGFLAVQAPPHKDRLWPSDREAAPVPVRTEGPTMSAFQGLKCTARLVGNISAYNIVIPIKFNAIAEGPYRLLLDPLGKQEAFTFYMFYACYVKQEPRVFHAGLTGLLTQFPKTITLQLVGESQRREVPLTMPFRDSFPQQIIFLAPASRRWNDLPPCN